MTEDEKLERIARLPVRYAAGGAALILLCLAGLWNNPGQFYRSYLIAFVFWVGITLGCIALLMIQHLTGGNWALMIRRILEAGTRTLPLMALAALPLIAGMKSIYAWDQPQPNGESAPGNHVYLNPQFFIARMVFYFVCWGVLAFLLNRWSREEERGGSVALWTRLESLSGGGLVLFGLTVTFASVDWVMSLEPRWYSTIYGLLVMVGMCLTALALAIAVLIWLAEDEPMASVVTRSHFQDLGSFLLTFVMLWAYLEFSQYLITWGGNLSDEIPWYLRRMQGTWGRIGLFLIVFNFGVPFFLLLFRGVKRRLRPLAIVALLLLVMRLVDAYWMVLPAFGGENARLHWMNIFLPLGMGGLWLAYFFWQLPRLPLLPANDPRMKEVAEHAVEHG